MIQKPWDKLRRPSSHLQELRPRRIDSSEIFNREIERTSQILAREGKAENKVGRICKDIIPWSWISIFLTCCYIWSLSQSVYSISSEEEGVWSSAELNGVWAGALGVNWMIRFPLCCTQAFERSISNASGGSRECVFVFKSQPSFQHGKVRRMQGCLWLGYVRQSPS